jgi:tight adherence protein C
MTLVAVLGAATGLGLWLAWDAMAPARPHLAAVLTALNTTTTTTLTTATTATAPTGGPAPAPNWRARTLAPAMRSMRRAGLPRPATVQDLAVLDRDPASHLTTQLSAAIAGLLAPALLAVVATAAGVHPGWQAPVAVALLTAVVGGLLPQVSLHTAATRRRAELRHALSALLDLVVIALSGGAGVEQALTDASRIGHSWGMRRLRAAIDAAALARVAPWRTLAQLGADTAIPHLQELAAAVQLAGGEGARVRASLTARAATLRARQAAELKGAAKAANQRMVLPLMLLGLDYLIFLLYPAIEAVKASL